MKQMILVVVGLPLVLTAVLLLFGIPVGPSLSRIVEGAVGSHVGIARSLAKMTPLLLTGLGVVVAWRAKMFSIGGEGQFIIGALGGAWTAALTPAVPGQLRLVLVLCSTLLFGAAYGWIAGWLQVKRGVQAVISTILLNFIALQVLSFCVQGPLKESGSGTPQTALLPDSAMLPRVDRQTDLHLGVLIALLCALILWVTLFRTVAGFQLRLVGENADAARAAKIPFERVQLKAMALSGALCGLAGGIEYTALAGRLDMGFPQDWGFMGIPVGLLGGLHPLGVPGSALFFGALFAGTQNMARFGQGSTMLVYVVQAAAVLGYLVIRTVRDRNKVIMEEVA